MAKYDFPELLGPTKIERGRKLSSASAIGPKFDTERCGTRPGECERADFSMIHAADMVISSENSAVNLPICLRFPPLMEDRPFFC